MQLLWTVLADFVLFGVALSPSAAVGGAVIVAGMVFATSSR
jgi:drug/metabolite transporter (DMT)-like permease